VESIVVEIAPQLQTTEVSIQTSGGTLQELEFEFGRMLFLKASKLDAARIPQQPDFTVEQVLDREWLPWQPD
jgi:hypothetical protein